MLDPVQLEIAWIAYGFALLIGAPIWWTCARRDLARRGVIKRVGGLTFVKAGRFGGSFYTSKRSVRA